MILRPSLSVERKHGRGFGWLGSALALLLQVASLVAAPAITTTLPAPVNAWAAQNLYVLDKDTNGVYINANVVFVSSLTPAFPEIKSLADLIGRNDFYFYPADLANQFRADDHKVEAGVVPFSTVEVNEPLGGPRTVVHVTKMPLRDEAGIIIGLRAVWHTHPQLEAKRVPGGLDVSFPSDAGIFQLERGEGNAWLPVSFPATITGGKATVRLPATNQSGFFRLAANEPVRIGALLSLTGEWSSLGKVCETVLGAGLEVVNLEELSSGSPLHFTADIRDTKLSPELALEHLKSLADAGVKIVIGPQSSAEARLLKPYADANGILLVSPGSTASSLSIPDDNLYRFCPDDTYEAEALVALLQADGIQSVVPIWRDDAGNQGLHNSTARLFPATGGVISAGLQYGANETNFPAVIDQLTAQVSAALVAHPGKVGVFLAAFDEAATILRLASANSVLASVKWYGSDGLVQSTVLAGDAVAAKFAAEHFYPCPTFGLDERYRERWQPVATLIKAKSGSEPDAFALAAYDAMRVAVTAYRSASGHATFPALKAAFVQAATTYVGATGPTLLNPAGDRAGGAFDFWSLKAGANGYVWYRSAAYQPPVGGAPGAITRNP